MAKISLPYTKTDQFRQGHKVLIVRMGTTTCPVAMLEDCMAAAEITPASKLFLFWGICKGKDGEAEVFRVCELYHSQGAL